VGVWAWGPAMVWFATAIRIVLLVTERFGKRLLFASPVRFPGRHGPFRGRLG